jgi:hypothetical protein
MSVEDLATRLQAKYPGLTRTAGAQTALTGKYLADVIKFMLGRIPENRRANAVQNLKHKLSLLNDNELAQKHMPPYASIGQSLTLVKTILFGAQRTYIREVINSIIAHLG